jgi:hypothetical protein
MPFLHDSAERFHDRGHVGESCPRQMCAAPRRFPGTRSAGKCGRASAAVAMASTNARTLSAGSASDASTAARPAPRPRQTSAENLAVERGLALEVVIDHRLVDARRAGDAVDLAPANPRAANSAAAAASSRSRDRFNSTGWLISLTG